MPARIHIITLTHTPSQCANLKSILLLPSSAVVSIYTLLSSSLIAPHTPPPSAYSATGRVQMPMVSEGMVTRLVLKVEKPGDLRVSVR